MAKGNGSDPKRRRWQREIERWQRSGEPVRAFCERRGLSEPSFYYWRRRLGAVASSSKPASDAAARAGSGSSPSGRSGPGFAELQLTDATAGVDRAGGAGGSIELELPTGERLRVGPEASADHLRRVLTAVREARGC